MSELRIQDGQNIIVDRDYLPVPVEDVSVRIGDNDGLFLTPHEARLLADLLQFHADEVDDINRTEVNI